MNSSMGLICNKCRNAGTGLGTPMYQCPNCNIRRIQEESSICDNCGFTLEVSIPASLLCKMCEEGELVPTEVFTCEFCLNTYPLTQFHNHMVEYHPSAEAV